MGWLVLFAALQVYLVAWVGLTLLAMRLGGIPVERVSLGYGPAWWSAGPVRLGVLPLGGFVQGPADAPLPGPIFAVPHLLLFALAAVFTPVDLRHDVGAWLGGWVGIGEVRLGLVHALIRAAGRSAVDPGGALAGTALLVGGFNVALGLLQWAGRRWPGAQCS